MCLDKIGNSLWVWVVKMMSLTPGPLLDFDDIYTPTQLPVSLSQNRRILLRRNHTVVQANDMEKRYLGFGDGS